MLFNVIKASFYKEIIRMKRYAMNTVFSIALFYIVFLMIWFGYGYIANSKTLPLDLGNSFSAILVAYYSWTMILSVFTNIAYIVHENRKEGTMENIIANSESYTMLLIAETVMSIVMYFFLSWINIFLFSITTGIRIEVRFFETFYLIMFGLMSILGLSLFVAGISIIIRKVENLLSIFQFVLLGALFIKDSLFARVFVPFFQANMLLRNVFLDGANFMKIPIDGHAFLIGNAILFLFAGLFIFNLCLNYSKKKGSLGAY